MRRQFTAAVLAPNGLFRSNSRASASGGGRRSSTQQRLFIVLLLLLLLSIGMVLWISSGHQFPSHALHIPHGTLMPHHTAAAKPHVLAKKFMGNLDFPLWWHAPFIAQSGKQAGKALFWPTSILDRGPGYGQSSGSAFRVAVGSGLGAQQLPA